MHSWTDRVYKRAVGTGLHVWRHYLNTWQQGRSHCSSALLIVNGSDGAGQRGRAALPLPPAGMLQCRDAPVQGCSGAGMLHRDAPVQGCSGAGMLWSTLDSAPVCFWTHGDVSLACCLLLYPLQKDLQEIAFPNGSAHSPLFNWNEKAMTVESFLKLGGWGGGGMFIAFSLK